MTPQKIKVVPLAAESLGVRSMCTYVETPNLRLLLDAGVSISPKRFGLPPHPQEYKSIKNIRQKIAEFAEKSDIITISHYHFDHHTPSFEDWLCNWTASETAQQLYERKVILSKNYRSHINPSQRRRGWVFEKTAGKYASKLEFVDNRQISHGQTKLKFSPPVFHGLPNTPLGWVLMTTVEYEDERVLFASDVQGPMDPATSQIILAERPQLLIIGGPPLYLVDFRVNAQHIQQGLKNLETLTEKIPIILLDHHLLRESKWRDSTKQIFKTANDVGNKVVTAAEFLGEENRLLEAKRKQLFKEEPPNREFREWSKLHEQRRRRTKPPL
ncbi:MAG: hypothetical protein JSV51_01925 [Candidatus Bathyarchaeota archaeon]|nr:MAG: hypothetical protein JSV51_01925 [Candidatus Bathyarchaeota archaeon]